MASKKKKLRGMRSVVQQKTIPPDEPATTAEPAPEAEAQPGDEAEDESDDEVEPSAPSSDDFQRAELSHVSQSLPVEPLHSLPPPPTSTPAAAAATREEDNERPTPVSVPLPGRASVPPSVATSSPPATVTLPPRASVAPPPPTTATSISEPGARVSKPPAPAEDLPTLDDKTIYTGDLLKKIRESRGVTLKEISQKTRIGAQSLSAIEEERFDDLPNARIYVRGFVRAEAMELALDADQVEKTYLRRWDVWNENQRTKLEKTRLR